MVYGIEISLVVINGNYGKVGVYVLLLKFDWKN